MTALAERPSPHPRPTLPARPSARPSALTVLTVIALAGGAVARLWPRSALWLDEAQSVAIARPPLSQLPAMLKADGAPPLYYAFLHGWMRVFGDADYVLRLPTVMASFVACGLCYVAGRRLFSARAGQLAAVVVAANSFAIRYGTEVRMYTFVMVEVLAGILVVHAYLNEPTRRRWLAMAALAAALLYTHYWAPYLLVATGAAMVWLVVAARRGPGTRAKQGPPLGVLAAQAAGGVAFLPWLGVFVFQSRHTATPWAKPAEWWQGIDVIYAQFGGHRPLAYLAGSVAWAMIAVAVIARRRLPRGRGIVVAFAATLAIAAECAVLGSMQSSSAFSARYTSIVAPIVVLLVAVGLSVLPHRLGLAGAAVLVAAGLTMATNEARRDRSPAHVLATAINQRATKGDVVVFCPDQLGPAVRRELGENRAQLVLGTFPDWTDPTRVVWIDYEARHRLADASRFAAQADAWAGSAAVWLVWSDTYPPTQSSCATLRDALTVIRGGEEIVINDEPHRYADHGGLLRYG